ncbi:phosphomevalonate kinase [Microbacterium sp. No. 7]|uniref:phosphomevalonate kinase n=1 Tax=Microbacterium sp. No. 7 TaxID=1714373 RepID=UPI0006D1A531|nr:phosphomevalonate kinase [Microbacterium sp. No. 7]
MSRSVVARAPGKLFVAGEYAVVSPGEPAVLVAVDRFLTATLTPHGGDGGRIASPALSASPLPWRRAADGSIAIDGTGRAAYLASLLTLADRLRAERGIAPAGFDLAIDSGLDDDAGRKLGLGSSAAVVVATARALDAHLGLGLQPHELFRLCLLATVRVAPAASGGDLAASCLGGWVGYRSPDRAALARVVDAEPVERVLAHEAWRRSRLEALPAPRDLRLLVGWTGSPAATTRLVADVAARIGADAHAAFVRASRSVVAQLGDGLAAGDDGAVLDAVRRARDLLQGLGAGAGVGIETERLRVLCDTAVAHGAAAKTSGAGGGDCGIALAPPDADAVGIVEAWHANGILPLPLRVADARSVARVEHVEGGRREIA